MGVSIKLLTSEFRETLRRGRKSAEMEDTKKSRSSKFTDYRSMHRTCTGLDQMWSITDRDSENKSTSLTLQMKN